MSELAREPEPYQTTIVRRREDHIVSRRNIDPDALHVLYHLSRHGFVSYLVGGSVRDLLLGRKPKDFDVGTSAHPNQIKKLFRNCFLIGRRFRLAHIKFGSKIIETSTFRRQPETTADPLNPSTELFHHRDNTFGTPEEDAARRDFTINGLFYDIRTFAVIDHVAGLADLERRLIRSIGDPNIRFREDPVRMIRAVRFASRLGFKIEPATWNAILTHHAEIAKAAKPRLLEELYKLFPYQAGESAFRLLRKTRLLAILFPELNAYVDRNGDDDNLLWRCLAALDRKFAQSSSPIPPLIFGALCYPLLMEQVRKGKEQGQRVMYPAIVYDMLKPIATRLQMPKRVFFHLVQMFSDQQRLHEATRIAGKTRRLVSRPSFPDSLTLYEIYLDAIRVDLQPVHMWRHLLEDFLREKPHPQPHRQTPSRHAGPPPFRRRRHHRPT